MKNSLIIMDTSKLSLVFGPTQLAEIAEITSPSADAVTASELATHPSVLSETEIIFSSWGMPTVDEEFLDRAPRLEAIHHAAGTVRSIATEAMFNRGVALTSAWRENAIPVAEFTLAPP